MFLMPSVAGTQRAKFAMLSLPCQSQVTLTNHRHLSCVQRWVGGTLMTATLLPLSVLLASYLACAEAQNVGWCHMSWKKHGSCHCERGELSGWWEFDITKLGKKSSKIPKRNRKKRKRSHRLQCAETYQNWTVKNVKVIVIYNF